MELEQKHQGETIEIVEETFTGSTELQSFWTVTMIISFQCSSLLCCYEYCSLPGDILKACNCQCCKTHSLPFQTTPTALINDNSANFMLQQDGYLFARLHI
jgi:hypothetical protein